MINIYCLQVCIEDERKNESLQMEFPLTIATVPYRLQNSQFYSVTYDFCVDYIETEKYISIEFRLGSVYDGQNTEEVEDIILYRPVYVRVVEKPKGLVNKELLVSLFYCFSYYNIR